MRTIAHLVFTYFARMPGLRWITLAGLICMLVGPIAFSYAPSNELLDIAGFLGSCLLVLSGGLMPLTVGQLARSHAIYVLPNGRLKLFLSALVTVLLVAIPLPLGGAFAMVHVPPHAAPTAWQLFSVRVSVFGQLYPTVFLVVSWLYTAAWFATSERTLPGLAKCLLVIIALIYVPSQRIVTLDPAFPWTALESVLTWAAFGAWLSFASRLRNSGASRSLAQWFVGPAASKRYASGREFELLLGTGRPWLLAGGMLFPIAIQTLVGFKLPNTWLFYLTLFSIIAGGLAGRAAERSRAIWLRARCTREQLFSRVEAAFWKHNSYALALLLVLLVAVVHLYDLPDHVIPLGAPLLVLGMASSTYLGLMMTRGLQWIESTLAIIIMLALMGVAVLAAGSAGNTLLVIALEVLFGGITIVLRFFARYRWHHIDWALCRPERDQAARAAA